MGSRIRQVPLDTEEKLMMKRKDKRLAEKPHESCGVWLDTSALKRRKLENLIGKPALRTPSLPSSSSAPTKVSFPRTKQTTISTFFRTLQAEKGETDAKKSLLLVTTEGPSDTREGPLPASVTQPVVVRKQQSQQLIEEPQRCLPGNRQLVPTQRNSCVQVSTEGVYPTAEEEYPFALDLAQHREGKSVLRSAPGSQPPLRERNSDWEREETTPSSSRRSPKSKRTNSQNRRCRAPSSDAENINPQSETRRTQGEPLKSFRETQQPVPFLEVGGTLPTSENGSENSQVDVAGSLFTQDSEGFQVISHRFLHGRRGACVLINNE